MALTVTLCDRSRTEACNEIIVLLFCRAGEFRASMATVSLSTLVDVSITFARTASMIGIRIVSHVERLLNSLSVGGAKTSEFRSWEAATRLTEYG